jgi:tetraacyldisaccharide 4'-kinase
VRRTRRRKEGKKRPSVFIAARPTPAEVLQKLLRLLLIPVGRLFALYRRLETRFHAWGLCRTCRPAAATVGVGGMSSDGRGRVLLTSWLLGWAEARGLTTAVIAPPGDGNPPASPFQVLPGGDTRHSGIETGLLARYVPFGRILVDADPGRAARSAIRSFAPDMLVLHDALADPRLSRDLDLAILTPDDLGPGFNRVFPAGRWRRDVSALAHVSAFCVFAGPLTLDATMAAAQRRLSRFGKPIFGMTFHIWRWRGPTGSVATETLAEEPYIAVLGESDREILPDLLRHMLGTSPRLAFFVHDRHRFTRQDFENLRADACRLRVKNVLTSPRLALKLRQGGDALDGLAVWTYDPEVVFGPSLFCDLPFLSWWEGAFTVVARKRQTP